MFKKLFIIVLSFAMFMVSACGTNEHHMCANFINITNSGSTDITFKVTFEEEKRYFDKGFDILIKSNTDTTEFVIKKELEDFVKITLKEKDTYYSLYRLMADAKNEKFEYTTYKNSVSKIFIINSENDFTLTLKVVAGEISEYKSSLLNIFDISKSFDLDVKNSNKD